MCSYGQDGSKCVNEVAGLRAPMAGNVGTSLENLFRAYGTEIIRYAQRLVGSKADAEDIAQEAFLRISRGEADQDDGTLTRHYLYATAHNLAIDLFRRKQLTARVLSDPWIESQMNQSATVSVEREYIAREDLKLLLDAIDSLSPRRRQVFVLARVERHSYKEISEILGTSVSTVKQQVAQAAKDCRAYIEREEEKQTEIFPTYSSRIRP